MRFLLNQQVCHLSPSVSPVSVLPVCLTWALSLSQICPALNHAALVHVNAMLDTIPVRTEVDEYIGIDYSLIDDPVVTSRSLDMHFRVSLMLVSYAWVNVDWCQQCMCVLCLQGMFFDLSQQNATLANYAVDPVIREYDRMIYLALSEFFFDSGMYSYYTAGIFQMHIVNERVNRLTKPLQTTAQIVAVIPKSIHLTYCLNCFCSCLCHLMD